MKGSLADHQRRCADTMLAAVLHANPDGSHALRLEEVPTPGPPGPGEVIIRVAAAGLCHSDLHLIDGEVDAKDLELPVVLGHEIAGWVEECGAGVSGLQIGEAVVALCVWGCGLCQWCSSGDHELCRHGKIAGATANGGFAELVAVPREDRLVALGDLDPVAAAPLADAALTPYRALLRVSPAVADGSPLVVIGLGGLGEYAVQLAKLLTGAPIVAVDPRRSRRSRALELGADVVIDPEVDEPCGLIQERFGPTPVGAVLDLVGSDTTLAMAASLVGPRGIVAVVGLAGGAMPMSFRTLAPEASWTTVLSGGNRRHLLDVVQLARRRRISGAVTTYPLRAIDSALADLRNGRIEGRAVLTPAA